MNLTTKRFLATGLAFALCLVAFDTPLDAKPSANDPAPVPTGTARTREAIRKGLDYLYAAQKDGGVWDTRYSRSHTGGPEALVVLAALTAGDSLDRPQIKAALESLGKIQPTSVYARSFRVMAYARLPQADYGKKLAADVAWLVEQQRPSGGWGYGPAHDTTRMWTDWVDMSNTQLALLALHEAAAAKAPVPPTVWTKAATYIRTGQNNDGGWGYDPPKFRSGRPSSYGSMTAAGVASLVTLAEHVPEATVAANQQPIQRGVKWLGEHFTVSSIPGNEAGGEHVEYYYHALARVGGGLSLRSIGGKDWRGSVEAALLARQRPDGSWGDAEGESDPLVRTCFAIIVLSGNLTKPVVSRLSLSDDASDSRDVANLATYLSGQLKRPLGWQKLSASDSQDAFDDAPLLYVTGQGKRDVPADLAGKIVLFGRQGGIILLAGDAEFNEATAAALGSALGTQSARLDAAHPAFAGPTTVPADAKRVIIGIGDHVRTRAYVFDDLSATLRQGPEKAAGTMAIIRNILACSLGADAAALPAEPAGSACKTTSTFRVARVRHQADWDVCPLAMRRLSPVLAACASVAIEEAPAAGLAEDVNPAKVPLLWLTGSTDPKLSARQTAVLKKYVQAGGTVFVDSAAGREEFFTAVTDSLRAAFGRDSLEPLTDKDPLMTGEFVGGAGADITTAKFTAALAAQKPALKTPPLWCVRVGGRPGVIVSQYGVTCPIEGLPTPRCLGLSSDDAKRLAANVILNTLPR